MSTRLKNWKLLSNLSSTRTTNLEFKSILLVQYTLFVYRSSLRSHIKLRYQSMKYNNMQNINQFGK